MSFACGSARCLPTSCPTRALPPAYKPSPHHSPTPQTYTAPQAAGQYRYIMGGKTIVGTGDWLDEEIPTAADKAKMTQAQVGAGVCTAHARQPASQPALGVLPWCGRVPALLACGLPCPA